MSRLPLAYSRRRIQEQVARLGRRISRDYSGRSLDIVVILENAFIFGADLLRNIRTPVVCHFVRSEIREIEMGGHHRREVFFSRPPQLKGRDVLVVDSVLFSGITQDFLMKRLSDSRPRSLRLAVLFDKDEGRRVDVRPDYSGFAAASNYLVGYGLADRHGRSRNLPDVHTEGSRSGSPRRRGKYTKRVQK